VVTLLASGVLVALYIALLAILRELGPADLAAVKAILRRR
jgi:hypothetical protein